MERIHNRYNLVLDCLKLIELKLFKATRLIEESVSTGMKII